MKNKTLSPLIVALFLIISAGAAIIFFVIAGANSLFRIASVSGSPAEPVTGYGPSDHPVAEGYEIDVEEVVVDQVEVEFGLGSPLPVHVIVSGNLPDTCSQIEYSQIVQDGTEFEIVLSAVKSQAEGCIRDALPFKMRIPLNLVYLPEGEYSVSVNGVMAEFSWNNGSSADLRLNADQAVTKTEIEVVQLEVDSGVASPIPVKVRVSGDLPSSCSQLGEIWMRQEGSTFYVRLIASTPTQADCIQDTIISWLELPLNTVGLPEGRYEVDVNGVTTSFELPLP